jgi:hypothetical protein
LRGREGKMDGGEIRREGEKAERHEGETEGD